ncbi:transmembrane and death domain protein 1-like [Cheilinus undulatus]|uniref:transmembrane and death domain protein 1-like n=1 Tax=Cheilinus undulatus TaxID=241271 RepID=UPI001BD674E3|nr:transmembrane and death domain protein 1-like [Cheilinus undulatus]
MGKCQNSKEVPKITSNKWHCPQLSSPTQKHRVKSRHMAGCGGLKAWEMGGPSQIFISAKMKVWMLFLCIFLRLGSTLGEDTVSEDIGVHQLERLVELLTSTECEDLLFTLSHPEENIFKHLERLSPEKNQLGLKPRAKRDTSSAVDSEAQCRTALTDWLLRYGEQTYYDRLSRTLQHIGRTDIAIEVGKNINQDKVLSLKRYVEDYQKYVSSLKVPPIQSISKDGGQQGQKGRKRTVRDLTWRDMDLIVERAPVPLYQRGPLDVALPLLYGLLLGFGGTLLMGVAVLKVIIQINNRITNSHQPTANSSCCSEIMVEDKMLEDQSFLDDSRGILGV